MGHMRDDVPGDSVFQLWRGVVGGNHQGTTGTSVSQRPGRNSLLHAPTSYSEQNRVSSNSAGNVGSPTAICINSRRSNYEGLKAQESS